MYWRKTELNWKSCEKVEEKEKKSMLKLFLTHEKKQIEEELRIFGQIGLEQSWHLGSSFYMPSNIRQTTLTTQKGKAP